MDPLFLRATSVGSVAGRRISKHGEIGHVHSVFRGVINLLTRDDHLASVVRSDIGKGPINIVTNMAPDKSMLSVGVKPHDIVIRKADSLFVGSALKIFDASAKEYKPPKKLGTPLLPLGEIRKNLVTMKRTIASSGRFGGLGGLVKHLNHKGIDIADGNNLNPYARAALNSLSSLLKAIREGQAEDIGVQAGRLIGLGPGLTPSADDVLSGLMASIYLASLNLSRDTRSAEQVNHEIMSRVAKKTTKISEEYLVLAAAGETIEPVSILMKRLLTAKGSDVKDATENVLSVGETSGTDMALGILLGTHLSLD